jgi:hypothetical protein
MKKTITMVLLFINFFGFAQFKVAEKVKEYEKRNENFKNFSILTPNNTINSNDVKLAVDNATLAKIDLN